HAGLAPGVTRGRELMEDKAMHGLKGDRVLMRIYVGEMDKHDGKPLYAQIVELLRQRRYAGATVLRGIMSFGASAHVHTVRFLELSGDLPIVIECVETAERIDEILPELDQMIGGGLITLEKVNVIMYRAAVPPDQRTASWPIDTR